MSTHHPPLTCSEFETILSKLGFKSRPRKSGTSHEDWVKTHNGRFFKVTVDCPKAPFSQDLIGSMAKQAGVTKGIIYDIHFGRRTGGNHGQELTPRHVQSQTPPLLSAPVPAPRFEVREQGEVEMAGEFWCVWDTLTGDHAFGGQYRWLSYSAAVESAEALNSSAR